DQVEALGEYDEQRQFPGTALAVFQVHHDGIHDLGQPFHDRVELGRAQPDAAPVEGGIGAAGDDAAAALGDGDPVAVPPDARVHIEIGLPVTLAGLVAPEADRHARHRRGDDQLTEPPDDPLASLLKQPDAGTEATAG